jgi:regulator of sigma E protease
MLTALLVIAILVLLIVAHEFGHFLAAKLFRVKVVEFGVGYPPRAFSFGFWGGTEYTLNWIPFGGFVRLFGDDGDGQRGNGSYVDAPRYKQALILLAGVTANVLIAWVLFAGAYALGIAHVVDRQDMPGEHLLITDVVAGSPAEASGVRAGDELLSVVDPAGAQATLTPDGIMEFVSARGGEDLSLTYLRAGATSTALVAPAHAVIADESGRPAIGVGVAIISSEAVPWKEAFRDASISTYNTFFIVFHGLWTILVGALHGAPDLRNVTGPVGLVSVVGEASHQGIGYVMSLAAFISVNLAVINLIPIPALDGGRLLVVIIESILRRPAPRLAIQTLNALGVALIITLMVVVTYHDIARLIA